jgi:cysteine synthase
MPQSRIIEIIAPELNLRDGNRVFTSLEGENPGGSMKDHMVAGEIAHLFKSGQVKKGSIISEVSAGSTAISLAYYCQEQGLRCTLFVPNTVLPSLVESLTSQGAEVFQEDMANIYPRYEKFLLEQPGSVRFDQLFDFQKRRHYHSLGQRAAAHIGDPVSALIGAVGTGHSLLGTAEGAKAHWVVSTEPQAGFAVSGVRNIELNRYGERDELGPQDFNQRVLLSEDQLLGTDVIKTDAGMVKIGPSFKLVLAGVQEYLHGKSQQNIFALGASLKRV